jgi:hypothetical protein
VEAIMLRILLSLLCALSPWFAVYPAVADVPDTLCGAAGCEYLVKSFSGSYPDEKERVNWECYDESSKASISCTFVRGDDILNYSDVYRKQSSSSSSLDTGPGSLYKALKNMPKPSSAGVDCKRKCYDDLVCYYGCKNDGGY